MLKVVQNAIKAEESNLASIREFDDVVNVFTKSRRNIVTGRDLDIESGLNAVIRKKTRRRIDARED